MLPVAFTGEKATMLATLWGRALDAESPNPILNDTMAAEAVRRIDFDFTRTGLRRSDPAAVALRARHLDRWARESFTEHSKAIVCTWAPAWTPASNASTPGQAYGGSTWTIPT